MCSGVGTGVQSDTQTHCNEYGCRHWVISVTTDTHKYVGLIFQSYRTIYWNCMKLKNKVLLFGCEILCIILKRVVIENLVYM
jgi:hypothetical protein